MEHKVDKQKTKQEGTTKKRLWGGYIAAGLIFYLAQSFNKSTASELIIVIIAIGSGFLYYPLKSKVKIKNEPVKIIVTFLILEILAGMLTGFLTTLANNFI